MGLYGEVPESEEVSMRNIMTNVWDVDSNWEEGRRNGSFSVEEGSVASENREVSEDVRFHVPQPTRARFSRSSRFA